MTEPQAIAIAWTTLPQREEAERLACEAVDAGLAACAQVDGPIRSHFTWEGRTQVEDEFRVTFKFTLQQGPHLEAWVHARHPYALPQWIVIEASHVSPAYRAWILGVR